MFGATIGYVCYLFACRAQTGDGLTDNMWVTMGYGSLIGFSWFMA